MPEFKVRDNITVYADDRSVFGFEFFTWRSKEMVDEMNCFIKYAKGKYCFFDVGAGHGIFSLVFSKINSPHSLCYAFEPDEQSIEVVRANIELNNVPISANRIGVSETMGENRTTIDDYCDTWLAPECMKIDVEGNELKVLRGAAKVIEKYHPIIFLELHSSFIWWEDDVKEILKLLKGWNYKILNSQNDSEISDEEILKNRTNQLRLICLPSA